MHVLTGLIFEDMKPALGVTEPGAIAWAVALAREVLEGRAASVVLRLNSGMFKNAFTCGIPGCDEVGNVFAAALGAVAADAKKGLLCLEGISDADVEAARRMVSENRILVEMTGISSRIFIEAQVTDDLGDVAVAVIRGSHTNLVRLLKNKKVLFEKECAGETDGKNAEGLNGTGIPAVIHGFSLEEIFTYARTVPLEEISFIREAFSMNEALMMEGLNSPKTTFGPYLLARNGGELVSLDERKTAALFCGAAIEARVIGLPKPAMSITGSGAHGVIATMPLLAAGRVNGYSEEALLRATALSYLICMYIKEYSGKLSAFCGCAIAAGTGMACGLVFLRGGGTAQMADVINHMAGSITGMICDGGNQGCAMKGIVASDTAFTAVDMVMHGVRIEPVHGICGSTPEDTMRFMGQIASPGMVKTEGVIVGIMEEKARGNVSDAGVFHNEL